jgi:hypothetical protein
VAESPTLAGLGSLDLTMDPIGPEGAAALANARFNRLEALFLLGCGIEASGAAALARAPALARLKILALPGTPSATRARRGRVELGADASCTPRPERERHRTRGSAGPGSVDFPDLGRALELFGNAVGEAGRAALEKRVRCRFLKL